METSRIRIDCPECGSALGAKPSAMGRTVKCPKCQHHIEVLQEKNEIHIQVPATDQTRPSLPARKPRRLTSLDSALRDERIFFRLVGILVTAISLVACGFVIGQHYTMSQVEISREAGMILQCERNEGVKRLFDALAGKPDVKQTDE